MKPKGQIRPYTPKPDTLTFKNNPKPETLIPEPLQPLSSRLVAAQKLHPGSGIAGAKL